MFNVQYLPPDETISLLKLLADPVASKERLEQLIKHEQELANRTQQLIELSQNQAADREAAEKALAEHKRLSDQIEGGLADRAANLERRAQELEASQADLEQRKAAFKLYDEETTAQIEATKAETSRLLDEAANRHAEAKKASEAAERLRAELDDRVARMKAALGV